MKWRDTDANDGVKLNPMVGGLFKFRFPTGSGHVNYLEADHKPLKIGQIITVRFDLKLLSGNPVFKSLDPAPAPPGLRPNVRPMLAHDTLENRWWPQGTNCGFLKNVYLDDMQHGLITVPVLPEFWQDVNGKPAKQKLKAFKDAVMHDMRIVALTFGGGNSFGHGLFVTGGEVVFQLREYSIK